MAFVHWSGFGTGVEGRGKMAKKYRKEELDLGLGFSHVLLFVYMASQLIGVFEAAKLVPCRLRAVCKLSGCGYCLIPGQDANMSVR